MPSTARSPIFRNLHARSRDSLISRNDCTYEKRRDGADEAQSGGGRSRRTKGSGAQMTDKEELFAHVCWVTATGTPIDYQDEMDEGAKGRTGRPPEHKAIDIFAFSGSIQAFEKSLALTELELHAVWDELRAVQQAAFPDLDDRLRLSERPPSQWQYRRFRAKYAVGEALDEHESRNMEDAFRAARHCGMLEKTVDGKTSTITNPHRTEIVGGDCSLVAAIYRARPGQTRSDDGEPLLHDSDAICPDNSGQPKHHVLFGTARNENPGERFIVVAGLKPEGKRDAEEFTNRILDLRAREPALLEHLSGVAYDMDMRHSECDRLLDEGIAPICKVARTNKGHAAAIELGKRTFKHPGGATTTQEVTVIDGTPTIPVVDLFGLKRDQPLELVKHQHKPSKGRILVYATYQIPNSPYVPRRLIGFRVRIRQNSTPQELESKMPRTRASTSTSAREKISSRRITTTSAHS